MANQKYSDEFRAEAIKQITERGYSVKDVSQRLGGVDQEPVQVARWGA